MFSIVTLIVDTVAMLVGGVFLLRFWMQATRVRPPASVAQVTFQLSDWLVRPLRRVIPGVGGYDWATLLGAYLIVLLSTSVFLMVDWPFEMMLLLSLQRFLTWIIYGFIFLLVAQAILSWVNPSAPMAPFIGALTEPLLRPVRKVVPPLGGLDLSFLVVVILLQILLLLLNMAFGGR